MADLLLAAGAVTVEAKAGGAPKVSIDAYGGGLMSPGGFGPVVIDLAGLQLGATVPLLADHAAVTGGMVGRGAPAVRGGRLYVEGQLSAATEAGREVIQLGRDRVPLQASVGVEPTKTEYVRAGESVAVNGRTITAAGNGFRLVKSGKLKEVSIVALGADDSTSVSIAARAALKGKSVDFDTFVAEMGFDPADLKPTQRAGLLAAYDNQHGRPLVTAGADAVEAEEERQKQIRSICGGHHDIACQAINEGWHPNRAREVSLVRLRGERTPARPFVGDRTANRADPYGRDSLRSLEASLVLRAGHQTFAEKHYRPEVLEAADRLGRPSLADAAAMCLRADGRDVPADRNEMIRAAFSTVSLPETLSNVANKSLLAGYQERPATWRSFAAIKSSANFKENKSLRPHVAGELAKVGASGELTHAHATDEDVYSWTLGTYGKMLTLTRQTIINDDLGAFDDILPGFGRAAFRALNDLVYSVVLGAGSHYSSGNGNYIEGSGTVLSLAGLETGIKAVRTQRDDDGNDLDLVPRVLAVGPSNEATARQLLTSLEVNRTGDQSPTGNAFRDALSLEVEPRLENSAKFSGTSSTAWYLFCGAADVPLIVGFLDGRQTPTVEVEPAPFNVLGTQFRVFFDFAAALGDPKASLKSKGSA